MYDVVSRGSLYRSIEVRWNLQVWCRTEISARVIFLILELTLPTLGRPSLLLSRRAVRFRHSTVIIRRHLHTNRVLHYWSLRAQRRAGYYFKDEGAITLFRAVGSQEQFNLSARPFRKTSDKNSFSTESCRGRRRAAVSNEFSWKAFLAWL